MYRSASWPNTPARKRIARRSGQYADVPSEHFFGGGLFYTGRRGLEIGAVAFTRRNLRAQQDYDTDQVSQKPVGYMGSLVFRALW